MTIVRKARHVTFTAANEGLTLGGMYKLVGLTFQGTGLTAGQRLTVRDHATPGNGEVLADYVTEAATDNADLWGGRTPQIVTGLSVDTSTIAGTWVLTAAVVD